MVSGCQCTKPYVIKEEIKMNEKSLLDLAFDVVSASKNPVPFDQLWKAVIKEKGLDEATANSKVGQFYTNLLLDGRFVNLGNNTWDLRSRQTFDKVHIDMKGAYTEDDNGADDAEESAEEKEYNEAFEEKVYSRDDEIELEPSEEEDE